MEKHPASAADDSNREIETLVLKIGDAQKRLKELTGSELESVLYPGGRSFLLQHGQEQLRQSETNQRELAVSLKTILDALPAQIALLDSHGVIVSVNAAWQQFATSNMLQGPDFAVNQNYQEVCERVSGKDSKEAHAAASGIRQVLAGEAKGFSMEYACHTPNEKRWFNLTVTPVMEESLAGAVVMHIDVTERKQAEMDIRFNEQRYRSLVEATSAIVWDTPSSGQFTSQQPQWTAFTGQTFEELRGWGWLNAVHPDDRSATERVWLAAVASRSMYQVEHRLQARDKSYHYMVVRAVPIVDEGGTIQQWIGIHSDVTDRKSLEQQFLRAQRMESIGTLAGGVAHDLNNILAPIMMSVEILKLTATDPQAKTILETIEAASKRGSDIVRQVLSFARGMEGERVEVQARHLVKDIETIIRDTFPKNIQLTVSVANETWSILGDPTQLHQIVLNLCVNARDAMPNGGNLTVAVENAVLDEHYAAMNIQAKPGRYVRISVTDSGTGMPPEVRDKIFEPFFTTKEIGKGTGLGLSTVMAIVKSHEGLVNVYSELGKGSTFKVYLPAMEISIDGKKRQTQPIPLPRGHGETIMVVDDESSILTITSQTLQAFGYRVLNATDGAEAIAIYAEHKKDIVVVLTDMMMPVMDGPSLIRALQRITPAIKIVAASGLNANGALTKVPDGSVKHFLTKPYTAGTLLKIMRAILDEP